MYVTNEADGTLSVIEAPSNRVVETLRLGKRPRGMFLSRDGRTLFVALSGSPAAPPGIDESKLPPADKGADGIGIVDTRALKLVRTLRGVSDPERVAGSSDGKVLYVASEDAGTLVRINVATGQLRELAVGTEPEGVVVATDDRTVFVGAEVDDRITAVDGARMVEVGRVPVAGRPRTIALATDGMGYVAAENAGRLVAFDARSRAPAWSVVLPGQSPRPMGVVTAPDGRAVFVTTGRGKTLVRVDTRTRQATGQAVVGDRPWGVAISPAGNAVYTANGPSNDISVVDPDTMKVTARIAVGASPWGVVAGPPPQ